MAKALDVYFNQQLVGVFEQADDGRHSFKYSEQYLASPNAVPISHIMPLSREKYEQRICHAFFAGILPEESTRKIIGRCLGISPNNDFSMLEKIGGECAGAITILPRGTTLEDQHYDYMELAEAELVNIISELPRRPLLAGKMGVRASLAGVQDKLVLAQFNSKFFLPLHGAPSTHIIKPHIARFDFNTVLNEGFCLKLAKSAGLDVADCDVLDMLGEQYLLIKRFDRIIRDSFNVERLHQEDFCQALATPPNKKYQSDGGPTLQSCFQLIRSVSSDIVFDIPKLLDAVLFNYIIGNCDAHGKNFALLYTRKNARLAPLYDLLCTTIYPDLTTKMAMRIGKEYDCRAIRNKDFAKFAQDVAINEPLMIERLIELCQIMLNHLEMREFKQYNIEQLQNFIGERATYISNVYMK